MTDTETLLTELQRSHLVDDRLVEKLRAQVRDSKRPVRPQAVVKFLIEKGHVTSAQAERLLASIPSTEPAAPPVTAKPKEGGAQPAAKDDELGLAPLEEDEPAPAKSTRRAPAAKKEDALGLAPLDDDADLVAVDDDAASLDEESPAADLEPENVIDPSARDQIASLDEGDLVDEDAHGAGVSIDPLGGGDATHAAAGTLDTQGRGKRRRGWQSKRAGKNVWDSPLLLIGGGSLLLLVIVFGALLWTTSRGSGDEALAQADADFKAGSYTQAINKYDEYLRRFKGHHGASNARVNRGLAELRKAVEGTNDWPQALETAKRILGEIEPEAEFSSARPDLANLLPEIAEGLAAAAHRNLEQSLVDRTEEALTLVHGNVPTALKNAIQLNAIEQSLASTRHTLARGARTAEALQQIAAAVEPITAQTPAADARAAFETAYDVRNQLLRDYPELEIVGADEQTDPAASRTRDLAEQLAAAVLSVSQAETRVVRFVAQTQPPLLAEAESPLLATVALALRSGGQVQAEPQVIFVLASGAAYGLDAISGELKWRRYVGFNTSFVPVSLAGDGAGDALLADSLRNEIVRVDAETGILRWRCPLAEPFDAPPLLLQDTILAATRPGRLVRIDLASGETIGHTSFPQDLRTAPAVSDQHGLMYQVGDHSNLYVLTSDDGICREVKYLGHRPGTIRVPPMLLGRYAIIVENDKLRDATVRVLQTDEQGLQLEEVHTESLVGHVDVLPVVAGDGRLLLVATDRGALYAYEIGTPGQARHLALVAERAAADDAPALHYPLVRGAQLWVAGNALTRYDIQAARGRLTPRRVIAGNATHLQPPTPVGGAIMHVRHSSTLPCVIVTAHDADDDNRVNPLWETALAAPPVIAPQVTSDGAVVALTTAGGYYRLNGLALSQVAVVDHPTASINVLSPPNPLPVGAGVATLSDSLLAVSPGIGEKRLLLVDIGQGESALRWLPLPRPLAAPPAPFGENILLPDAEGAILVIDPRSGRSSIEPFQPPLAGGESLAWTRPEPVGEQQVVVSDGRAKVYLLGVSTNPKPHLTALHEATVTDPVTSAPAALSTVVYAADAAGKLIALGLPDLADAGDWTLGGAPVWGPRRIGDVVLVATAADELLCLDDSRQLRWRMATNHGPLAGDPLVDGDSFILVFKSGAVARVAADSGQERNVIQTDQSWATGAVPNAGGLLIVGHDGSLHQIDAP